MKIAALSFVIFLSACSDGGVGDYSDAVESNRLYCSMVAEWEEDTRKGIKIEDRGGWPPYRGSCDK